MSIIINILVLVFIIKRVYWYSQYGTISKKEVKALKRNLKRRSKSASAFYFPTAVQMVSELYPNAPVLDNGDFDVIVSHFIAKKDVRIPDRKTWDEVIGDYLLCKQKTK